MSKKRKNKTVWKVIVFVLNKEFTDQFEILFIKDFRDDYYRKIFSKLSDEIDMVTLKAWS